MKKSVTTLMLFACSLLFSLPLQANHITGGHWHYECLGGNDYLFTLTLFRDCSGNGANFDSDPNAPFAGTVSVFLNDDPNEYENIILPAPIVENINANDVCDGIPACLQKGTYTFVHSLPSNSQETVHFVYQRCCLAKAFANIDSPGDQGMTLEIEVTPEARAVCNNSPVCSGAFTCSPPNQFFLFPGNVSDVDGDELSFEFCTPLRGAGTDAGSFESPFGVAPNPDTPPPHDSTVFLEPIYTAETPFGEDADITLDPSTGVLSGQLPFTSRFMYSVCIDETRGGVLLSRTRCTSEHWSFFPVPTSEKAEPIPLSISPNPGSDEIRVELPSHHLTYDVEIRAIDGRSVLSFSKINSGIFYAKVEELNSGMYTIRATRGDDLFLEKWMKR